MPTILADSFTTSLAKLNNQEQKQAKLTAFDLQTNPDQPGLQFHRIDKSKDPNFWSVRVNRDLRIIVHKLGSSLALVHVDHHDDAYKWAERRRIEEHPRTGAIQIVEVRELVEELAVAPSLTAQPYLELEEHSTEPEQPSLFDALSEDDLLSVGVPKDWISDVESATEDGFFSLVEHLPPESSEALLEYAATGVLKPAIGPVDDPLFHPDTQRRFRVLEGAEELEAALEAPFDRWAVFLHPAQQTNVDAVFNGPARVAGSAGTGKTVVALHRVAKLLKSDPDSRILLTTFSDPLAYSLKQKLRLLMGEHFDYDSRVSINSFLGVAKELFTLATGLGPHMADRELVRRMLASSAEEADLGEFSQQFTHSEWENVVDAWQLTTAGAYGEVPRMGRKNRLGSRQRERLWPIYEAVRERLKSRSIFTPAALFAAVSAQYGQKEHKPFDHIVVDEAQDLGVAELRFLASIASVGPDALFFAGDIGQRIFQQPFSWKGLGVDVRGRSSTLRVNYRTSHQIRKIADALLPQTVRDVDGLEDDRRGTVSVFDGMKPEIAIAANENAEKEAAVEFVVQLVEEGFKANEIGIFYRSPAERARARAIAEEAALPIRSQLKEADTEETLVGLMHLAKGLEFRAVLVVCCDEGVLPLEERVSDVADEFELDEVIGTEKQLLYVACTRARERLFVSGVKPGSDFMDELTG